jgi:hypothetical protein
VSTDSETFDSDADVQQSEQKPRPRAARPTRDSTYPVSTDFSDFESEPGLEISDTLMENLDETARNLTTSTSANVYSVEDSLDFGSTSQITSSETCVRSETHNDYDDDGMVDESMQFSLNTPPLATSGELINSAADFHSSEQLSSTNSRSKRSSKSASVLSTFSSNSMVGNEEESNDCPDAISSFSSYDDVKRVASQQLQSSYSESQSITNDQPKYEADEFESPHDSLSNIEDRVANASASFVLIADLHEQYPSESDQQHGVFRNDFAPGSQE